MKIIVISIRTRPPYMVITQMSQGQHNRQVTKIEVKAKCGIYNITYSTHGTIDTGEKEETFTTAGKRTEDWRISTPRPRHLTPARNQEGSLTEGKHQHESFKLNGGDIKDRMAPVISNNVNLGPPNPSKLTRQENYEINELSEFEEQEEGISTPIVFFIN
jgi:hypothetical protein